MKRFVVIFLTSIFVLLQSTSIVFAEDKKENKRDSQEYDEIRYELMTHADDKWYEIGQKTGTSIVTAIKNMLWEINKSLGYLTMMIVYNLFSLDIISMTKDSVQAITAGTAGSLLKNFGGFAMAIASVGIVINAYVKQDWRGFFKILTLILVSLTLLFSIQSKKFNYIKYVHSISIGLENAIMKVNPTLSKEKSSVNFKNLDMDDTKSVKNIAIEIENKVFDAVIYKPYLLLQYGSTDEKAIQKEGEDAGIKYDKKNNRITEYLNANPMTNKGIDKREDIKERELKEIKNSNIFAGNGFKSAAYIIGSILTTTIQGVVFFFLALMRILMQFAMICMFLLLPIILIMSLFPSFEAIVGKYVQAIFKIILFKGILVFFILVSTSFISLSYDITNASSNMYYRIFVQIIFSLSVIFLYAKRQFALNMLDGASVTLNDMGASQVPGERAMRPQRLQSNRLNSQRNNNQNTNSNPNQGKQSGGSIARKSMNGIKGKVSQLRNKSGNIARSAGAKMQNTKSNISAKAQGAKDYISQVQQGNIPNHTDPYSSPENQNFSDSPYHNEQGTKDSPYHTNNDVNQGQITKKANESNVMPIKSTDNGRSPASAKAQSSRIRTNNVSTQSGNVSYQKPKSNHQIKNPKYKNQIRSKPHNPNNNSKSPITQWEAREQIKNRKTTNGRKPIKNQYKGVRTEDYKGVRNEKIEDKNNEKFKKSINNNQ